MRAMLRRFIRDEEAATAIEYALIAGLIALAIAAAIGPLGEKIAEVFESITTTLTPADGG
ncbi:MAG: Flp family type IVb pilin [Thiohalomonadaceae bacterium]